MDKGDSVVALKVQLFHLNKKHVLYWAFNLNYAQDAACGPGSIVSITTGYGLDGPGIKSRWRRNFPHLSRWPPVQWVLGLSHR